MSRSSADPEALIGYAASMHTEGQAVIDHVGGAGITEKLDAVRTRCSEYVSGEIPDVASQVRTVTLGAQELDVWAGAVGEGFLLADTSGAAVVQVEDEAVIANLPPGLADPPAETHRKVTEGQRLFNDLMVATEERNHDRIEEILGILEERQGDTAFMAGFVMKVEEVGGIEELQERIEDGLRPKNREGFFGGFVDVAAGAWDSVRGTAEMLHGLIPLGGPLRRYSVTPDEAAENWANLGRGLWQSARLFATNRPEFVRTFLDIDGLLDNPERWLGAFVPDLVAAVFSGGAGAAARGARGLDAISDAAEATRNLDRVADGPNVTDELTDLSGTVRRLELGKDPATGTFRPGEAETALRIEAQNGITLERAPAQQGADWVGSDGKTYDAVGNFPSRFFDQQWEQLQFRIQDHLNKADYVPVDVSQFTPEQVARVREFVEPLGPRVFIVGG